RSRSQRAERVSSMNAVTHPVAQEEVIALLDRELSPECAKTIMTHIDECTKCQKARDSLRNTSQSLALWAVPTVSGVIEGRVLRDHANINNSADRFISNLRRFFDRRSTLAWGGAAAGAALMLVVFLGSVARHSMPMREAQKSPSAVFAV